VSALEDGAGGGLDVEVTAVELIVEDVIVLEEVELEVALEVVLEAQARAVLPEIEASVDN
jgi:hypothetical protein